MALITINLLRWNTPWDDIQRCINAVLANDFVDFELVYMENSSQQDDRLSARVKATYCSDPRMTIVENGTNLGYAGGHNRFFRDFHSEYVMVLNPDAVLDPSFLGNILAAFDDPRVAAVTGKMCKPGSSPSGLAILDGTGIVMSRSRRGMERGQLQEDRGQYDDLTDVFGVSGTAAVYRKSALEAVKLGDNQFFDSDFFAYWEDVDLSWRLLLQGYRCRYVPTALVTHGRATGVTPNGWDNIRGFIRHYRSLPLNVRKWSWRNHICMMVKNDFGRTLRRDLLFILAREAAMLGFILCFVPTTLAAVPDLFRLFPVMLRKRRRIQHNKCVTDEHMMQYFN